MVIISGKLIWILELNKALNRRTAEITFDPHLFDREEQRNLDIEKILPKKVLSTKRLYWELKDIY